MSELTIEGTQDAAIIAQVHQRTVTSAYRSLFPSDSAAPTREELTSLWEERLADPTANALVASRSVRILGTVAVRRDPDFDPDGQLLGLHVLPNEWGHGVGTALHDTALAALTAEGYQEVGLWVIAANSRARTMYENRGWVLVPKVELDFLGVREVRYARHLRSIP